MKTNPYLFFGGRCEDAIEFYRDVLGAELRAFVRFGDMPGAAPGASDKVMHAELGIGALGEQFGRLRKQRTGRADMAELDLGLRRCGAGRQQNGGRKR